MARMFVLLIAVIGLATARVADPRWMTTKWNQMDELRDVGERGGRGGLTTIDRDPLRELSSDELMRQKFLLRVLDRVQQPLVDDELLRLADTLVVDESKYIGGINEDMLNLIQLCREGRLLSKRESCSISNRDHVRQMIGLYRLFRQARDWDTLVRNVCYARSHVNGVLFVNALLLALREREDTCMLIIPAIHEILPEVYLDENLVRKVQSLDLKELTTITDRRDDPRQRFIDMIGMGGEGFLQQPPLPWMAWRNMRMQMGSKYALIGKKNMLSKLNDEIVIPVLSTDTELDTSSITNDIGLKGFLQLMINDLCLRESTLGNDRVSLRRNVRSTMIDREDILGNDGIGRVGMRRNIGSSMIDRNRWTSERDDDNNWKRFDTLDDDRKNRGRSWMDIKRRDDDTRSLDDDRKNRGRSWMDIKRRDDDTRSLDDDRKNRGLSWMDIKRRDDDTRFSRLNRFGFENSERIRNVGDDLPTTTVDDERLLHINRRRIPTQDWTQGRSNVMGDRFSNAVRYPQILENRRTIDRSWDDMETLRNDRIGKRWNTDEWRDVNGVRDKDEWSRNRMNDNVFSSRADDDRLLFVNRRRKMDLNDKDMKMDRDMDMERMRGFRTRDDDSINSLRFDRIVDSKRKLRLDDDRDRTMMMENNWQDLKQRGDSSSIFNRFDVRDKDEWSRNRMNDNVFSSRADDDRLLFVNRRRKMDLNDKDMKMDRDIDMERLRGFRTRDDDSINDNRFNRVNDVRDRTMMMGGNRQDINERLPRSDVLLHNIRQVLARLIVDRIALRSTKDRTLRTDIFKGKLGRIDEITELRGIDRSLGDIQDIARRLMDTVGLRRNINDPIMMDREIINVLLRPDSDINILNIIREMVADKRRMGMGMGVQRLEDLGIDLKNTNLHKVLQGLIEAIDLLRTNTLGVYTKEDLILDGVAINDVIVDKLNTIVDQTDIDVNNLIDSRREGLTLGDRKRVVARQQRLNHKDFNIRIDLDSDRNRRVVVRMMLVPKLKDISGRLMSFDERRQYFIILDTFLTDLRIGKNMIQRRSDEIIWTARDTTPLTKIYENVMLGLNKNRLDAGTRMVGQDCRFPHRLLLPRGLVDGLEMELLVIVNELKENESILRRNDDLMCAMGIGAIGGSDRRSLGFPLDRRMDDLQQWMSLPNLSVKNVMIMHRD